VQSGNNGDGLQETVRNLIATAALGLFGWHLLTLHNISKSVEVLVNRADAAHQRLERLENYVFVEDGPSKK
jgi:hypothetical protein